MINDGIRGHMGVGFIHNRGVGETIFREERGHSDILGWKASSCEQMRQRQRSCEKGMETLQDIWQLEV